jgi:hypothetical protein
MVEYDRTSRGPFILWRSTLRPPEGSESEHGGDD